jgi:hypothetical protein
MNNQHHTPVKSVTFAPTASMRLHRHINDYTTEEIQTKYYSRADFREFKRDIKLTLRMMEMKQKMDDISCCQRGVECLTKQALRIRSKQSKAARFAVVNKELHQFLRTAQEQEEEQGRTASADDEKIAIVYSSVTRESVAAAYHTGLSDEQHAKEESSHYSSTKKPTKTCRWRRRGDYSDINPTTFRFSY